ncbi:unnamed protein product [Nippostrongylus brasiliensis]|uniref:Baculoviral IAP repeat-containing protein 5 n=1 Tax=Nippostrongylus brasiliensis TaxID=27835 RepID=A0A0N4Y1P2_NIPBR|nr:unnamed protein product [Nippostrongylus brasiliensis]
MSREKAVGTIFENLCSDESNVMFYAHRKATFKNWCFDKVRSPCTSEALAKAGFVYSGNRYEPANAKCVFCLKEMIFEEQDDPWEEHQSHTKGCAFVELGKLDEKEWTVKDFFFLLAGWIAARERKKIINEAETFRAAAREIEIMAEKALNSKH